MPSVEIPNAWSPTRHQQPLWDAMAPADGMKRGIAIWHRRAGKDSTAINLAAYKAHQQVGTYWHLLPTNVQARRIVWDETDRHGRRIIDQALPPYIRARTSESDMAIRLLNGSLYQLGGSDNYNSLVGANVRGVIFSEWALCDPAAWNYIRPILVENGGWALFIYTPRGRNHGWTLWQDTREAEHWFRSKLNVTETQREDGSHIMTEGQVRQEIADGMSEEAAAQEFYCSFAAGVVGAYFARALETARDEGRIGVVPWDQRRAVHLYFDLGIDDATACWFGQRQGWMRKWIDYREWKDQPLVEVFSEIASMGYRIGSVNLPHDGRQRDKGTGTRIEEYAEDAFELEVGAGIYTHEAYPVQDSIEAGRLLIRQSYFDEEKCERGLQSLMNYAKVWDEKRRAYQLNPRHDWASHGADAWRLAGMDEADEPIHTQDDVNQLGPHAPRVLRSLNF